MTAINSTSRRKTAITLATACVALVLAGVGLTDAAAPAKDMTAPCGVKLRLIPAGEFMMGSPESELGRVKESESPLHKVRITKPFYIGVCEVTQGQWTKVTGTGFKEMTSEKWTNRPPVGPDLPMYWISWFDALSFCNKLSEKDGRKPYYKLTNIKFENYGKGAIDKADVEVLGGDGYRLPTEAQWEYACRAGTKTALSNGKNLTSADKPCANLDQVAWYDGNTKDLPKDKRLQPVGTRKPNAWGLHDMHGGLIEWCHDEWDPKFYEKSPVDDPVNTPGAEIRDGRAAVRGGAYLFPPNQCRSAWRRRNHTCGRYVHMGFRIVAPVRANKKAESAGKTGAAK